MLIANAQPIRADKTRGLVRVPGGVLTLVLIVSIFVTKYAFGFLHATQPRSFAGLSFWLPEVALSGMLAGMFIGRFAGLLRLYQAAPHEDLAT